MLRLKILRLMNAKSRHMFRGRLQEVTELTLQLVLACDATVREDVMAFVFHTSPISEEQLEKKLAKAD